MEQKDFLTKMLGFLQTKRQHRWWLRMVTGMAVVVIFLTVYLLILPAVTMEKSTFEVTAASSEAVFGENIYSEIHATADDGREETFFVLTADGNNAGLNESQIHFDDNGVTAVADENGQTIQLHREYTENGASHYWFVLKQGQSVSFRLPWINGTDRYRAETVTEDVPSQTEETPIETEIPEFSDGTSKEGEFAAEEIPSTDIETNEAPSPEPQEQSSGTENAGETEQPLEEPSEYINELESPAGEDGGTEQIEDAVSEEDTAIQDQEQDTDFQTTESDAVLASADIVHVHFNRDSSVRTVRVSTSPRLMRRTPMTAYASMFTTGSNTAKGENEKTVCRTAAVLEQQSDPAQEGALTITFGQGGSLESALSQADGAISLTWKAEESPQETPAEAAGGDTLETDGSPMAGANALFALSEGGADEEAETEDGSNSSSHDFSGNITSVTVSKLENGQWVPSTEFTDGDSVRMEIHYTIPQYTVGADNQTIHYRLPDGIRLSQQEQGTVYDGQTPVGTYTISQDGLITIVFNDHYADDKPFTGQIQFQGTVSAQQGQEDTEINFGAGGTITVKPNLDPTDVRADKSGSYNEQDGKLHYTIEVTTTKGTNGTIKVTDSFQSGNTSATYDTDSFQIIKKDANGLETAINGYTPDITSGGWDGAPQQFTITDLPALQAGESYRITYTATPGETSNINGYSDVSNYVTTTTSGGDSGSDWNQVVISQNKISKGGNYDSAAGVINWTITINPDKRDIGGYTLTDTINANGVTAELPSTVTLTGSDGSTQTITLPYTFPAGSKDTYTITYQTKVEGLDPGEKASVTNDAHLTHEDEDYKAESTVWPQGQDFSSSKSYGWHDGGQDTGSTGTYQWNATITVPSSVSVEELSKLTFTDAIHNLVAADGSMVEGSHYITAQQLGAMSVNINGVPLAYGTDYKICDANGTEITELTGDTTYTGFQIKFTEAALTKIAGQTISLQYYTTVDYTKLTDGASYTIRNTGGIPDHETTPETGYHKPGQLEKQAKGFDQWGNETWLDNGASLDFEASQGVIHYRLLLHTSADTKGDLTVKDILPSGASLVEESAYLRFYYNDNYQTDSISWNDANGNQKYTAVDNFNAASETSDGITTLTFTVKDGYNNDGKANTLAIYYDVSIAKDPIWTDNPGLEEHLYTNRASWGDSEATTDVTVERDVPELEKTGAQLPQYDENGNPLKGSDGKELLSNTVRYTVTINPGEQDLDPNADVLQLVDTFGNLPSGVAGADLSIGSVKLYLYDADKPDHLGSELSNARYSYTYDSDNRVLTFTIPDSMGLVLVYDYTIDRGTAAGELTLSNAVELTGVAGSKTEDQTHLVETSSSATVTKRTLTIYKVDGTNYGRTLPGAEFKLEQFENNQWTQAGIFTSDENGQIVFNQVGDNGEQVYQLNTLYRLTETKAPTGYAKDDTQYYFVWLASDSTEQTMEQTISDAGISKDNVLFINDSSAIYVPNQPTTLTVQKVWTDQDGNETAPGADGVEVKLYRQTMTTNAVTVTVTSTAHQDWSTTYTQSIDVAKGSTLTIQLSGVYINSLSIQVNGAEAVPVATGDGQNWSYTLQDVNADTSIRIVPTDISVGNSFGPITFSNYTEPYHIPSGEKTLVDTVTLKAGNKWSKTWENLPRADENGNPYYYTVEETKVPGYSVIYSSNNQNGIQTGQLVITNRASGYILPESGGTGTLLYTTGGLALMALAGLMYKIILRRKGDEAP